MAAEHPPVAAGGGGAARWEHRYDGRPDDDSRHILEQVSSGLLDLGPGMRGADGAVYRPGGYTARPVLHGTAVVLVQARGGYELLTGWDSPLAAWAWVRSRHPSADGPLQVPEGGPSRTAREEQLLAWGLRYPWELDRLASAMSWRTFSCDARDEIFAAAVHLHRRGGTVDAGTVAAEVSRRYARAPAWAREDLGGPQAPWLARYVHRLAATEVTPAAAAAAVTALGPCTRPAGISGQGRLPVPAARPQAVMMPPGNRPRAGPALRMQ